ncbi:MAG: NAD(P)H-hydrate dehydratase [Eubacteriales bacterium]|nr:NAD(P)H-hydrate dehydratase [Eubacteriales bacterium]
MKTAVSCKRMKELDRYTISRMGVPSLVLMERAALAVTEEMKRYPEYLARILVVCGSGNNGGDGFAIARLLHLDGYQVSIYFAGNPEHMTKETTQQKKIADNYQVPVVNNPVWSEYTTIVDALFGIGLSRPVQGIYALMIEEMNRSEAFRVAVDIPSGLSGDTGEILGMAVKADLTVTFAFSKTGQHLFPGRELCKRLKVADIGIYGSAKEEDVLLLEKQDLLFLRERPEWGNKGTFGKVLAVAGSRGMSGAAYLCARACLASGAGMVKIQTKESNRTILQTLLPEAMISVAEEEELWEENLRWCDVLVLGPGLGKGKICEKKIEWFLKMAEKYKKPLVLDADGLNLLAENPKWYAYLPEETILTPHLGEFSRLTGWEIPKIQSNLIQSAQAFVMIHPVTLVLKDARTVVVCPNGSTYLNESGCSAMATAGSGDVLSGVLAGLLASCHAQKKRKELIPAGVFLHGLAGERAARRLGKRGVLAGDIIDGLGEVLVEIEESCDEKIYKSES